MNHAKASGRLSMLAVGLGIGAVVAATPGVASADPSTDPFSWIGGMDLGDLSAPAQTSALDMQVSIDGFDLFPTAGNTATATSGPLGDIAIAIGNGANATAGGGFFDFAFADGTNSIAEAGGFFEAGSFPPMICPLGCFPEFEFGSFDLAAAFGDMLHAVAIGNFLTDILP